MKNLLSKPRAVTSAATLIVLSIPVSLPVRGQDIPATPSQITVGGVKITGVPNDWSHRHVVFSNPGTEEEAISNGKHDEWLRIVNEPRYIIQQLHRHAPVQGPAAAQVAVLEAAPAGIGAQGAGAGEPAAAKKPNVHKDWSEGLGEGGYASANWYPAKWSFSTTTASCANDFVVYPTGSTGSSTQASVIAYKNLYSGCSGNGAVPSVYWAYNSGGYVWRSPVLSADGSQVAFVQYSSTTGSSSLILLKWAASTTQTVTAPGAPTAVSASGYPTCTAPCMTSIAFSESTLDYYSDPYYDYGTDSVYVGDYSGKLHKFEPVFNGVPAEVTTAGWPVALSYGDPASPVYDPVSGCVFVGTIFSGYFYSVNSGNPGTQCTSTTGSVYAASASLTYDPYTWGIADGPILDPSAGRVYAFVADNTSYSEEEYCEYYYNGVCEEYEYEYYYDYYDEVAQFPTSFTGTSYNPAIHVVGSVSNCTGECAQVWAGAFDNVYFESSTPGSPSGHLYVTGTNSGAPELYQLTITNNVITSTVAGPTLGDFGYSSPVTEFCNNGLNGCASNGTNTTVGTDYIFVTMDDGLLTGCTESDVSGCVMSFTVSTPSSFSSSSEPNSPLNVVSSGSFPTGGIIIDNSVGSGTLAGASQIYFLTLDNSATCGNSVVGFCATQASQSAP